MIFVFGSNLAGIHGAGAARHALDHEGAIWKQGIGRQGNSYGIPTKSWSLTTLSLDCIEQFVYDFKNYAREHPNEQFKVTRIGCGLAGYTDQEIAPMFADAPSNCSFDMAWQTYLPRTARFWPTE